MEAAARHPDLDDDGYISVPCAAKLLGVSKTIMHDLLDKGRIPYIKPSVHRKVSIFEVRLYLRTRTHRARKRRAEVYEDVLSD